MQRPIFLDPQYAIHSLSVRWRCALNVSCVCRCISIGTSIHTNMHFLWTPLALSFTSWKLYACSVVRFFIYLCPSVKGSVSFVLVYLKRNSWLLVSVFDCVVFFQLFSITVFLRRNASLRSVSLTRLLLRLQFMHTCWVNGTITPQSTTLFGKLCSFRLHAQIEWRRAYPQKKNPPPRLNPPSFLAPTDLSCLKRLYTCGEKF